MELPNQTLNVQRGQPILFYDLSSKCAYLVKKRVHPFCKCLLLNALSLILELLYPSLLKTPQRHSFTGSQTHPLL